MNSNELRLALKELGQMKKKVEERTEWAQETGRQLVLEQKQHAAWVTILESEIARLKQQRDCRRVYYTARNILYVLLLHLPLRSVLFRAVRIAIGRMLGGILAGCGWSALRGVSSGLRLGLRFRQ